MRNPFWRSTLNVCLMAIAFANQAVTCAEDSDTALESFSIVLLPDTQNYSEKYPGTYVAQATWIRQQTKADEHQVRHSPGRHCADIHQRTGMGKR